MVEGTICVRPEWAMIRDMAENPALGRTTLGETRGEKAKTGKLLQLLGKRRQWQPPKVHLLGATVTFLIC